LKPEGGTLGHGQINIQPEGTRCFFFGKQLELFFCPAVVAVIDNRELHGIKRLRNLIRVSIDNGKDAAEAADGSV
jgi:putative effector of murein hydrolase LrgA (UPF0299 family)